MMVGVAYVAIKSKNPLGCGLSTGIDNPARKWELTRQQT